MDKLTYKQAFDKITEAYIKGEIEPFDEKFCFCGTLSPNGNWARCEYYPELILKKYPYTKAQYGRMEKALFSKMGKVEWRSIGDVKRPEDESKAFTEDELFEGMCAALEVLRQIHIERGDPTALETQPFTKRLLA